MVPNNQKISMYYVNVLGYLNDFMELNDAFP